MELQKPFLNQCQCTVGQTIRLLSIEDHDWLVDRMVEHPPWTVLSRELLDRTGYLISDRVLSRHAYGECLCRVLLAEKRRKPNPKRHVEIRPERRGWVRRFFGGT